MANKTSYKNVEGLVPLQNNGGKFIGIKNNQLQACLLYTSPSPRDA